MQRIFLLHGKVQHYDWGGYDFIPQLLGIENADQRPFAEYWLGAHPNHSAEIEYLNSLMPLKEFIHGNMNDILGNTVTEEFDSLPFLFKILDVRQMLSIQLHPHKESAKSGFDKEEELHIPVDADYRNYKDRNHKPEMMVALSDFWLLHGFRPPDQINLILQQTPELNSFITIFSEGNYEELCIHIMTLPQHEVNHILSQLVKRLARSYSDGTLQKDSADYWAALALASFYREENYDRGILLIYLLNLVQLKKGEAIYQPPQMLHSYMEGQNVEVMANSDNVLRAGLTTKYIDVSEVLRNVRFHPTEPQIIRLPEGDEQVYKPPVVEFILTKHRLTKGAEKAINSNSSEILFVLNGGVNIRDNVYDIRIRKGGQSVFILANTEYKILAEESSEIFRVHVPVRISKTHDNHS